MTGQRSRLQRILIDIVGWYGLATVVLAYTSVSLSFISPNTYLYQLLNLTGSFGLGAVAFFKRAYQNGVLNVVWAGIAIIALARLIL